MNTYFGGIFLIDTTPVKFLGKLCICFSPITNHTYPHFDFLFALDKKHKYDHLYKSDHEAVHNWLKFKEESGDYGFQSVFNDLQTAIDFKNNFIVDTINVATISIHLPVEEFAELSEWTEQELKIQNPKRGNEVYECLKRKETKYNDGTEIGYDLLETYYGTIYNMHYETEENFKSITQVSQLNQYGLLPNYESAIKGKEFSEDRNVWQIRLHKACR